MTDFVLHERSHDTHDSALQVAASMALQVSLLMAQKAALDASTSGRYIAVQGM